MKRDLSESDFAGLELQATRHADLYSPIGDNADEGNIFVALRFCLVATVLAVLAIGTGLYLGSVL